MRARAGLAVRDFGAPIDVLWMRLSKHADDPDAALGRFDAGRLLVTIDRGDYWQCGLVIAKGGFDALRQRGLAALRDDIVAIAPFLRDRVDELRDWDDVKLLTVAIDRLRRWHRPGAAVHRRRRARHVADGRGRHQPRGPGRRRRGQPAGRAAARRNRDAIAICARVQRRRELPVRLIQALQVFAQNRIFRNVPGTTAARASVPALAAAVPTPAKPDRSRCRCGCCGAFRT